MKKTVITFYLLFLITTLIFSQKALVIADLHFNPFYPIYRVALSEEESRIYNERELSAEEKEFIDKLIEKGLEREGRLNRFRLAIFYNRWKRELKHLKKNLPIGENTDARLFESMLKSIKREVRDEEFVLFMGDFLTHGFDSREYNRPIVDYILHEYEGKIGGEEALMRLKYSTMVYQLQGIRKSAGLDKPIYITLGNSDMYKSNVNYSSDYSEEFKYDVKKIFNHFAKGRSRTNRLNHWENFTGAYSTEIAGSDITLLSLSTNYFSPKNSASSEAEMNRQLEKLSEELRNSSERKVWIIMHIPPGKEIPLYKDASQWNKPKDYWHQSAADRFLELYQSSPEQIEFSLTGHTHKSEFKLYLAKDNSNDSIGFTLINPGVCLRSGNYPGYTLLERSPGEFKWDVYSVNTEITPGEYEWRLSSAGLLNRDSHNRFGEIKWDNLLSPGEMFIYHFTHKLPLFDLWWPIYNLGSPMEYEKTKAGAANEAESGSEEISVPIQYWAGTKLPYSPAQ